MAIIFGARAGFGPTPGTHGYGRAGLLRKTRALSPDQRSQRPFPLNIPGLCIGASEILSIAWVHAGLVG